MEFPVINNERLDKFLVLHVPELSRAKIQQLIKDGVITINGVAATKPSAKLRNGNVVYIAEEHMTPPSDVIAITPEPDIPLNIVYEDKDMLVVNKPAGLLTHPTPTQRSHTLVNALVAKYPKIIGVGENPLRPGIVHRLDKDTSGLLAVAKNQKAFEFLKQQFWERTTTKKYLALVEGIPKEKEGVIDYEIRPSTQNRLKKVAVTPFTRAGGSETVARAAKTLYKVTQTFGGKFALLEVQPMTGRTHQIRVHLAAIGHPIFGDALYGTASKILNRQFLHAFSLALISPSGKKLALVAPLPADLQKTLDSLK